MTSASSLQLSEQLLTWINAELRDVVERRVAAEEWEQPPHTHWRRQVLTLLPFLMSSWGCWMVNLLP
ncbi:hypothetical protein GC163_13085 [bacterium]|nr:hypothetical protein [bacterium]